MEDNLHNSAPEISLRTCLYNDWKDWWNKNRLQFWTSVWILVGIFFGIGIMIILINSQKYQLAVLLVWSLAFFLAGSLIGCIFGVPKAVAQDVKTPPQNEAKPNSPPDTSGGNPAAAAQQNPEVKPASKANTNLTDISEWLTKIVIGAGLVEIKTWPKFILDVGRHMAKGIDIAGSTPHSDILCAGLLVYYTSFGLTRVTSLCVLFLYR